MKAGTVIGVTGHMGAGKGLTLQLYAMLFKKAGLNIYTNYDSILADRRLENLVELPELTKGVLLWDEIDLTLHARSFGGDLNIVVSKWFKMIRKAGLRAIWATQNMAFVDINIRRVTHYVIECERIDIAGHPATRLTYSRVLQGGEMLYPLYTKRFRHTDALYASYDTLDNRMVLSTEPGGQATCALSADDFTAMNKQRGKGDKNQARLLDMQHENSQLRQTIAELERQKRQPTPSPAAPPDGGHAAGDGAARSLF